MTDKSSQKLRQECSNKQNKKRSRVPSPNQDQNVKINREGGSFTCLMHLRPDMPILIVEPDGFLFQCDAKIPKPMDIKLVFNMPDNTYLDQFWYDIKQGKFHPLHEVMDLFTNVKEQSESMSMVRMVQQHHSVLPKKDILPQTAIVVVADGKSPRTGWLLAQTFADAFVYSIDPEMQDKWINMLQHPQNHVPKNLIICKDQIQNIKLFSYYHDVCLVAPHSHVSSHDYLHLFENARTLILITMPCCFADELSIEEQHKWKMEKVQNTRDWGVHSEKNYISVWKRRVSAAASPIEVLVV